MKVTKYIHACVVLEDQDQKLIIDPGAFTELPNDLAGVRAVVLTHIHDDHVGVDNIANIVSNNPDVEIIAPSDVIEKLGNIANKMIPVTTETQYRVGAFRLHIFVGDHAVIYQAVPCQNLRVAVNDMLYHPGDSLIPYDKELALVCVPLSAPWSKTGEVMDFVKESRAEQYIPIHDAVLSELGAQFYNSWVKRAVEEKGSKYTILSAEEYIEL